MLFKLTPQAPAVQPEDTLPGVTPTVLTTLSDTRATYLGADAAIRRDFHIPIDRPPIE
ncbi:MAG: hypothetical protein ABI217_08555 [Chthoniobacterales bacterium]